MWNFLEWIRKFVGDQQKKPHSLWVPFFGLGICKEYYTLLWIHTCNELRFFQNFQDKPRNVSGVFTKPFPEPLCLFFFWNSPLIDRSSRTGLEVLPEPPQNIICYTVQQKYSSFSCFPIIFLPAIWKFLFQK